jgi:hypothetical protein
MERISVHLECPFCKIFENIPTNCVLLSCYHTTVIYENIIL